MAIYWLNVLEISWYKMKMLSLNWGYFSPHCLQFASVLDSVLSKLSRYDEGTFFSSILSFTVSNHVFVPQKKESAELFLSLFTEATCYLLETKSSQLNFSIILLLLPFRTTPSASPWKVKAAAKYVEVPVSLSICCFCFSPCLSHSFASIRIQAVKALGKKCKVAALCIEPLSVPFFVRVCLTGLNMCEW